jgi:superfamily II DNA or RNA helicase
MIRIVKINETYLRIYAEEGPLKEIEDKFKKRPENYRFDPRYPQHWDGYVKLFSKKERLFYIGLLPELVDFLKKSKYEYRIEGEFISTNFSEVEALEFIKTLDIPEKYQVRDYQLKYFIKCVRNRRAICLSPTNSGKSLIIYLLYRYFNKRTLLCVPTIGLVTQMFKDFKDYGYQNAEENIHLIMEGSEKKSNKPLVISTWQAIYDEKRNFYNFDVLIGDEAHTFQAKSLKKMMEKMIKTSVKIGLTGTLTNDPLANMTIQGLFGPVCKFISTDQMIKKGFSSPVFIKILELKHEKSPFRDNQLFLDYQIEKDYICQSPERIEFVKNLALSLKGNTFIMFRNIAHGRTIRDALINSGKQIYYVDGKDSAENRELIRLAVENSKTDSITICSTVFQTGINISSINNLIFVHPSKSRIRVLQSIGRGLRIAEGKAILNIFDISDLLVDTGINTTIIHSRERIKMYEAENFPFKEYKILLK